jgi:hypothetical protein
LDLRYLPQVLSPARKLYRAKNYSQALEALDEVDEQVQDLPLCKSFRELLERLTKKSVTGFISRLFGGGLASTAVANSTPQMRDLFEFLVAPEMKAAREALEAHEFPKAEKALLAALDICPEFALANHMLATSVYQRVAVQVKKLIGQDINEDGARTLTRCGESLSDVSGYAEVASRDPSIPDAKRVLKSIEEMSQQIEKVVTDFENRAHDAQIVNQLIDQFLNVLIQIISFNAIISSGNTYALRQAAESLYSDLSSTRGKLSRLRGECRGKEAKDIIDLVRDQFVEPNYRVLKQAMGR